MKAPALLSSLVSLVALAVAALAAGGRIGAAIGGIAALLVLLAAAAYLGSAPLRRASARRSLPEAPVEAGSDVPVAISVFLPASWPLLVLAVSDQPPPALGSVPRPRLLSGMRRRVNLAYTLHSVPRGLHRFSEIALEAGDALSLAPRRIALPCPGRILAYPQRVALDAPPPRGGSDQAERLPRGTRDFQPGDAPSHLHASRTAQRGFPQVREFEMLGSLPHVLTLFAPACQPADLELLLSCAASLAVSWLAIGDPVGLVPAGAPDRHLSPGAGPEQERRILGALAELTSRHLDAASVPRGGQRADLWLLTTSAQPGQYPGRVLRVGAAAGAGAVQHLSDLARCLQRLEP